MELCQILVIYYTLVLQAHFLVVRIVQKEITVDLIGILLDGRRVLRHVCGRTLSTLEN